MRREFGTPVKKASKAPIHPITSWLQRICVGSEQMKALDPQGTMAKIWGLGHS